MTHTVNIPGTSAYSRCSILLVLAFGVIVVANDKALAETPAAVASAQAEMQKWIATTDAQWQALFKRDVADVYELEFTKLKVQYQGALDTAIGKASTAGDLEGAVALRNEQKRFGETGAVSDQDEASDGSALKQLRAAMRTQLMRLEKDNATRTKTLHSKYDQVLAQAQGQLTQRTRLDDALLVKAKRDEVAAAWMTPAVVAALGQPATATVSPVPVTSGAKLPLGSRLGPQLAKVEPQDIALQPFAVGSVVWSDREVKFTEIPKGFEDLQFTQSKCHAATLRFKVSTDGLVQMVCSSRFAEKKATGWESEVMTERMLQQKGWRRQRGVEAKDGAANDYVWWFFTRQCKAGEEFSIRTEKYLSPLLLVK